MELATRSMNSRCQGAANVHQQQRPDSTAVINTDGQASMGTSRDVERGQRGAVDRNRGSYLKRGRCGVVAVGVDFRDSSLRDKTLVSKREWAGIALGKAIDYLRKE